MNQHTAFSPASLPRTFQAMLAAIENGIDQVEQTNYPPHNIFRTSDDDFVIEIAAAGFRQDEIEVSVEKNELRITATKPKSDDTESKNFLHKGIATRDFKRSYRLGEYVVVTSAEMRDGILSVYLTREVPEEAKPRRIDIKFNA